MERELSTVTEVPAYNMADSNAQASQVLYLGTYSHAYGMGAARFRRAGGKGEGGRGKGEGRGRIDHHQDRGSRALKELISYDIESY